MKEERNTWCGLPPLWVQNSEEPHCWGRARLRAFSGLMSSRTGSGQCSCPAAGFPLPAGDRLPARPPLAGLLRPHIGLRMRGVGSVALSDFLPGQNRCPAARSFMKSRLATLYLLLWLSHPGRMWVLSGQENS